MNQLERETAATRARYQRISRIYDIMEILPEQLYIPWRKKLWALATGPRTLEVGVGTGKNMPFYPPHLQITAIDLTPGMLEKAKIRAGELGLELDLRIEDVQELGYPDESFDTVLATCVFCSVPDPVLGLKEMLRVAKPGGQALFIEHVRSEKRFLGALMDLVNPLFLRLMGPNINRRTVENVRLAGWEIVEVVDLGMGDIFKMIIARKPSRQDKR